VIRYVTTNLTDMHKEPSFISELLTQVSNGVKLEVLKEHDDKWCYVRQTDGYEGWAYTPFLTETPAPAATHIITFPHVMLVNEPNWSKSSSGRLLTRLPIGTRVHVTEEPSDELCRIELGGSIPGGWLKTKGRRAISTFPLDPNLARTYIVGHARIIKGTYYLWGGCSEWGIDCSGLAQLCHRLCGYEIPRDCVLQFPVGKVVEPPFRKGDLLYFWNEARTKIGHVGISLGEDWKIIHSSRKNNGVYEEDVEQKANLKASYAGARSFLH